MATVSLRLHGREVRSVFGLLGYKENDLTYSLGWGFAQSPSLLKLFVREILPTQTLPDKFQVRLQHHGRDGGYTDIEIESEDENIFIIVEAKLGWMIPTRQQLYRYHHRFRKHIARYKYFVTLSCCNKGYAAEQLPSNIQGVSVCHISWHEIQKITRSAYQREGHAGKRLLTELRTFIGETMQSPNSQPNMVYVVSLSTDTPRHWRISWIDVIKKKHSHFFPFNHKNWPKIPPNYIAFRHHSQLQSIHFVKGYEEVADMHSRIPEIPKGHVTDCFLLSLGPGFAPNSTVKTGGIYPNGRVWCFIDTLFTSKTVKQARDRTKLRLKRAGND